MVCVQEKAGQVMCAAKDKACEAKDKAAGLTGNASGQGQSATDAAKQKASETAEYTKESAVAGKDKAGGVLQQATETVTGAVVGAKDAVVNTLGWAETTPARTRWDRLVCSPFFRGALPMCYLSCFVISARPAHLVFKLLLCL